MLGEKYYFKAVDTLFWWLKGVEFPNHDLNLPMSIVLAGLTFIGTAEGTRCSEMRESIEEIENLRRPPVFTTYDIIYQDR